MQRTGFHAGSLSRRQFLLNSFLAASGWPIAARALGMAYSARPVPDAGLDPFQLPVSQFFGLTANHELRDSRSLYKFHGATKGQLSFDLSNNRIGCCVDERGDVQRSVVQIASVPVETIATPVGAYVDRFLLRGNASSLVLEVKTGEVEVPEEWLGLELAANLYPVARWRKGSLLLETLSFAPLCKDMLPPEVVLTLIRISASGTTDVSGRIAFRSESGLGHSRFLETDLPSIDFHVRAGESLQVSAAHTVSVNRARTSSSSLPTERLNALECFRATQEVQRERFGELIIEDAPYYAELYVRAAESARQAITLTEAGEFGGSFVGSDEPEASTVWMKDCYYAGLAQCMHAPWLSAKAIPFFLQWSIPTHPLGDSPRRDANTAPVSNSLSNSVSALLLAACHYESTGDAALFLRNPQWLTSAQKILNEVLASRRFEAYLFPSLYVSDGDARGDFHTGSNLAAWKAFQGMARLAREVYMRPDLAECWQEIASKIQAALMEYCVIHTAAGARLAEGATADHSLVLAHDGEESDTTLMPFYGFCDADEPLYTNTAKAALSPENPYFAKELEGIWWFAHGKWSAATFPGWTTALAAADTEAEVLERLERIRSLTDADGAFWWWPYRYEGFNRSAPPGRTPGKCGWAAAVYQCLFVRNLLGITHDAPARTLRVRPFLPWSSFAWKRCRLGAVCIDVSYSKTESTLELTVVNRNEAALQSSLELILPAETDVASCTLNGAAIEARRSISRGRLLAQVETTLRPLESGTVQLCLAKMSSAER